MTEPANCVNIEEVRFEIDRIDRGIMELFAQRWKYVERIVDFKTNSDSIIAQERQNTLLAKRREWAVELGLDPDIFEQIYRSLIDHNIQKEMKILHEHKK